MKSLRIVAATAALAVLGTAAGPASAEFTAPRVSPKATVTQTLGVSEITLVYSRPGVRGRSVWGALVPWGRPWRTGANEATTFTCSTDLRVNGQSLPAGTYSFFTIPAPDQWTIVFSKQRDLWGAFDYDSTKDQLRVSATPRPAEYREWMDFSFQDLTPDTLPRSPSAGQLVLRWEKLQVPISIETDMVALTMAAARSEMAKIEADDWGTPFRAATFCHDNGVQLDQATRWARVSTSIQENYQNLTLLARLYAKAGRTDEAIAAGKKAVKRGKESKEKLDTSGTEKLVAEWTAKK